MITNFRDIGDITTQLGKLESGLFFRSGELTELNESDINFLKNKCEIKKVYDFRSADEIKKNPDLKINGIEISNIDILASITANGASLEGMLSNSDIHKSMLETYTEIVTSQSALNGYSKFLTEVLQTKQPILFHCFAGKDRTGFAAALILKISGASDEQIMKDYLKTNESRKIANQSILNSLDGKLSASQINDLKVALVVDSSYLEHAKEILIKQFGSLDNYLTSGLKLQDDYVEQFQKIYIQK
ncbi:MULTISPECIES: tyrosine-protein phosphatase [Enterococcus]|uniref:tyrosine-protein phosphatase n=1 Tax=Enterococcus sp. AZ103 TaxID=2774628 RepID=UPI003F21B9F9